MGKFSKSSVLLIVVFLSSISPEKNKYYSLKDLCTLAPLYRKIDGVVLSSHNEQNQDCVATFQTQSILQHFVLRFQTLNLNCNSRLYVYDGDHPFGEHKLYSTCRSTNQTPEAISTRTNFVTFKYVTDAWGTDSGSFKVVVTAVRDSKHTCDEFRCKKEFCIHTDLVCDGVNHCGDGSDETVNLCGTNSTTTRTLT